MQRRTHIVMPKTYWNTSHRKSCTNMFQYWPKIGRETHLYCHQATAGLKAQWTGRLHAVTPTFLPDGAVALLQRRIPEERFHRRQRAMLTRYVRRGELALVWPGTPAETVHHLKDLGAVVATEFINTHCQYSYDILTRAYARHGMTYGGRISPQMVEADTMRIREADIIFCPNAFVEDSIREAVPEEDLSQKIVSSSRGTYLHPGQTPRTAPDGVFTFVFVGEFGVRKGAPEIIRAMEITGSDVRLLVAGRVAPDFRDWVAARGLPDNIELLDFVHDIDAVYARSDALLFPSLEEGGPKVCYEAAALGLPMIVTEMGGGRIARDGETGYVVPPADAEALAAAVTRLSGDRAAYARMSRTALQAVEPFAWEAIARDRHAVLSARGL